MLLLSCAKMSFFEIFQVLVQISDTNTMQVASCTGLRAVNGTKWGGTYEYCIGKKF